MLVPGFPPDEKERLAELRALGILDTPPEERFDRIVRLASHVFDVPMALISIVDAERQWFKARCGLDADHTARDVSFCGHAILHREPLVVLDATRDERFRDNPLVTGGPCIRFYAGHPLRGPGGHHVGTLCVAASQPRTFTETDRTTLRELAAIAERELMMIDIIEAQRQLIAVKNALAATQQQLAGELADAARYVKSLLPARLQGAVQTDWRFISSSQLGGDFFDYHWLDPQRLAIYLLDVCGHGVAAALLSVSVHAALRRETLPGVRFDEPAEVLNALNRAFPMDENDDRFLTIWYGVYNAETRELRYSSGGHPAAVAFCGAAEPEMLGSDSLAVGMLADTEYETARARLKPGTRLYVFSDGLFEVAGEDGRMLDPAGLVALLRDGQARDSGCTDYVIEAARRWQGCAAFEDDVSLLELTFA